MVEGHQQNVGRTHAQRDLVLEGHRHQVVQLRESGKFKSVIKEKVMELGGQETTF